MSKWKRPSPELTAYLADSLSDFDCQTKKMFGSTVHFVNGNMMAGAFEDSIFLRLSEEDRERLLCEFDEATNFDPMDGRPMREYMLLPEALFDNRVELMIWLSRSYRFVSSLPVKKPK